MSSVPQLVSSHKAGKSGWPFIRWFGSVALCAILLNLAASGHVWRFLSGCAEEDVAEFETQTRAQVQAGQKAATEAARARAAFELDLREHPERYRASFTRTYHPTETERMAWARGEQTIGTAFSGSLRVLNLAPEAPVGACPVASVSASACGATVSIAFEGTLAEGPPLEHEGSSEFGDWAGNYARMRVTVAGPTTSDSTDFWLWFSDYDESPGYLPLSPVLPVVKNELSVTWAIALEGAYRKAEITQTLPDDQAYLRHTAQRTGTGHWFADEDTVVTVTASVEGESLSASGNYGAGSETDLTEAIALGVTPSISLNYAPAKHTDYATVTVNAGADVALDFTNWTFYRVSGDDGDWHWRGDTEETGYDPAPDAEDVLWYTSCSGNTLSIRAGDAYTSGGEGFSALTEVNAIDYELHLWKQNKEAITEEGGRGVQRYTTYDASEGHPFSILRYKTSEQTDADVSVAPAWGELTRAVETWTYAEGGIPDDKWRKFVNIKDGFRVYLRKDWMEANDEDVVFTDPLTTKDLPRDETDDNGNVTHYDLEDILQVCTFHPLDGELDDPPWRDDWITWLRTEKNLDQPAGATSRPSPWTGVGAVDVTGEVWTIPAGGGTVARTLATRRRNRIGRMNAHLWTGLPGATQQEVSDFWPLTTRANLPIEITGDDPKWWDPEAEPWPGEEVGVEFEDITDWQHLSCVELTCTGVSADQPITLRVTYRYLTGTNPYYTSAEWKYGTENGEFNAPWSEQQIALVPATLFTATGEAKFDFAPNSGETAWIKQAELVEKVEFLFSEEDTVTFSGWVTVPYSGAGSDEVRMRMAHKHSTDPWGAGTWVDGMPNYQPTYLSPFASDRVEVGYYHTQDSQHDPDYEGEPQDLRSLKSLAGWVSEQLLAETLLEPTWETAAIAAALEDADENVLGTPMWADYDEDGFALHVGTDLDVFFPLHTVYIDCVLWGGARGVSKTDGVRYTGADVRLYVDGDDGPRRIVSTDETDNQGMYRIGAGKEKAPRTYHVAVSQLVSLGGFVNAEEAWAAVDSLSLWDPYTCLGAAGNTWRIATNLQGVAALHESGAGTVAWQRRADPFGADTSGFRPCIAEMDTGALLATVTRSGGTYYAQSNDRGASWEAAGLPELGTGLEYGTIKHRFGTTYACGWSTADGAIMFRASSDAGLDKDDLTGGEVYEATVCEITIGGADPPRSDVVPLDDRSVLVTVDQSGSMQSYLCRKFAAISAFERVA